MYQPSDSDLIEMSLHSFAEHAKELLGKWDQLNAEQRRELREIAAALLTGKIKRAA